jgi:hypothetical protein
MLKYNTNEMTMVIIVFTLLLLLLALLLFKILGTVANLDSEHIFIQERFQYSAGVLGRRGLSAITLSSEVGSKKRWSYA